MADSVYITFGPSGLSTNITEMKYSFDGVFIAVGGEDYDVNVFRKVGSDMRVVHAFDSGGRRGASVTAIIWHPRRHIFLVGLSDSLAHLVSLEGVASEQLVVPAYSVINIPKSYGHDTIDWSLTALDNSGKEISGTTGDWIFTYSNPFEMTHSHFTIYLPVPDEIRRGHRPVALWYVQQSTLIIAYPLGIVAASTSTHASPWHIPIQADNAILSAQISPSKDYIIGITRHGAAEIYSLKTHSAIRRLEHILEHDPYPPFASAYFYNHNSLALCYTASAALVLIPSFNPHGKQKSLTLIDAASRGRTPYPPNSRSTLRVFHAGMVEGTARILVIRPRQGGPGSNMTYIIPDNIVSNDGEPLAVGENIDGPEQPAENVAIEEHLQENDAGDNHEQPTEAVEGDHEGRLPLEIEADFEGQPAGRNIFQIMRRRRRRLSGYLVVLAVLSLLLVILAILVTILLRSRAH